MYLFFFFSKKKKSKDKKRKREEDEETQLDIVGEPLRFTLSNDKLVSVDG